MRSTKTLYWALQFVFFNRCHAQGMVNFLGFPQSSQPCLNSALGDSGCPKYATTQQDANRCPCSNSGNFVGRAATCLDKNDPSELLQVWLDLQGACNLYALNLEYSEDKFLNGEQSGASSSISDTQPSSTSTSRGSGQGPTASIPGTGTQTSSVTMPTSGSPNDKSSGNNSGGNVGKLSSGAIALISALCGAAVLILMVAGFFWRRFKKKRKKKQEQQRQQRRQQRQQQRGNDPEVSGSYMLWSNRGPSVPPTLRW